MHDDAELLRRYVDDRAEDAFTELVRRHLGLVYGTALRRVGRDAQLAEDVAQKVFADLARKAASLRGHATLTGWLYVGATIESAKIVRSERRRKARETGAQTMQTLHDAAPAADWDRLRPALDEVIVGLRDDERTAIALRFFEQRSFAEVGAALRLTEEAARKRVDRALEKLRTVLARRGITSTAAMLGLALGEFGAGAAPVGLATKVAGHALAHGAAAGTGIGVTTLSVGLLAGAAIIGGVFAVLDQHRTNRRLAAELVQLEADSRATATLRAENQALARSAAEANELRRLQGELPALRASLRPTVAPSALQAPTRATVTVQADGTITWGREAVKLRDFVARLKALQETAPDGEAKIGIRGFAEFPAVAYVIDEARKAGVKHVVVESGVKPDPKVGFSWFGW